MKKLFFIAVLSVTAFANAKNTTLPTPKDIIKYGEKELNTNALILAYSGPGDDIIVVKPPTK